MDMAPGSSRSFGYTNPDNNSSRGNSLLAVASVLIVLETLLVLLRAFARRLTTSQRGIDDYLTVPSLIVNLGVCVQAIGECALET